MIIAEVLLWKNIIQVKIVLKLESIVNIQKKINYTTVTLMLKKGKDSHQPMKKDRISN